MSPTEARRLAGHFGAVTPMARRGYPPVGVVRTWRDGLPLMREVGANAPATAAQIDRVVELLERIERAASRLAGGVR